LRSAALGLGDDKYVPTKIKEICCGLFHSILMGMYLFLDIPTMIENLPSIRSAEAGSYHSILIDVDDNVYSCGYNYYYQLGTNPTVCKNWVI
jgi:hypothetical protein